METKKFHISGPIGRGGFSEVWLATETDKDGLGWPVALKRLLPSFLSNKEVLEDFRREAAIGLCLTHRHIARMKALIDLDGAPTMVLEYVDGPTLGELVAGCRNHDSSIPVVAAVHLIACAAEALAYAWNAPGPDGAPLHVIHRDLKPDNMMIDRQGDLRVMDFGIAQSALSNQTTVGGNSFGTPQYVSPEQAMGASNLTPASDVFSLGLVLFELVTGRRLYDGEHAFECMGKIVTDDARPHLEALQGPASLLKPVLSRMLARDAADRIADPATLFKLLQQVLEELPDGDQALGQVREVLAGFRKRLGEGHLPGGCSGSPEAVTLPADALLGTSDRIECLSGTTTLRIEVRSDSEEAQSACKRTDSRCVPDVFTPTVHPVTAPRSSIRKEPANKLEARPQPPTCTMLRPSESQASRSGSAPPWWAFFRSVDA